MLVMKYKRMIFIRLKDDKHNGAEKSGAQLKAIKYTFFSHSTLCSFFWSALPLLCLAFFSFYYII